nr:NRPS modules 1-3 [Corallococcus coralloides]
MWFLCQSSVGANLAYSEVFPFRVRGPLDVTGFRLAVRALVARHEALRTCFPALEGEPRPQVLTEPYEPRFVDATGDEEAAFEQRLLEDLHTPVDATQGFPLRVTLYRRGPEEHVVVPVLHHLVIDGYSMFVLGNELLEAYRAAREGRQWSPPAPGAAFSAFVAWQEAHLQSPEGGAHARFWKERLAGELPELTLPTDRPRPAVQGFRGASLSRLMPEGLATSLLRGSARLGVTPYVAALAAFEVLLARLGGTEEVLLGSPVASRTRMEFQRTVGYLVNMVVLRGTLRPEETFRELAARAQREVLDALEHQEYPLPRIIEDVGVPRRVDRAPLFQVTFRWEDLSPFELETGLAEQGGLARITGRVDGLELESLGPRQDISKFDLSLVLRRAGGRLVTWFQYDTGLFSPATIERLAGQYLELLGHALAEPETPVHALWRCGEEDLRLLSARNATAVPYPREAPVHQLLEAQARRRPDAVALSGQGTSLTYGELNARANQWARHLRAQGVERGTSVALIAERSARTMTCLLAILKAGGVYVPLDPEDPPERIAHILDEVQAPVVLGRSAVLDTLPLQLAQPLSLEALEAQEEVDAADLGVEVGGDDLAYIMYTSGSTGLPKGIAVPHRGIVRLTVGADYVRFGPDEVFLQLAPLSFDAATFELWGAWVHGGRVALYPPERPTLDVLQRVLRDEGVTTLWLTAGLFHMLVEERPAALASVRQLVAGGDALSLASVRTVLEALPGTRLVNGYGPTEGTTFSCCHDVDARTLGRSVPIGRPIANTRAYVLDAWLAPVPVGVVGELYVGGDGLARGYVERPALTAERFLPDPFASEPGARMYRTGDRVRMRADGLLEFLGRADHQVKVRGYRIELGEIEAALGAHPEVSACVVVVREDEQGHKTLVAYVVGRATRPLTGESLKGFLGARLPAYMLPHQYVFLPELPLTPRGKVDRRALPRPERVALRDGEHLEPRTPEERLLASIWAEELGLPAVGADEDFFALGGDSIRSIQVRARVRAHGLSFTIQQLFTHPTVAELARVLQPLGEGEEQESQPFALVSAEDRARLPEGLEDAYPVAALQAGMLFHSEYAAGSGTYHDMFRHRIGARLDVALLRQVLEALVARHATLRTTFELGRYREPLQLVHARVPVELHVPPASEEDAGRVLDAWMESERRRGFSPEQAPLIRFAARACGEDAFELASSFHHAILDGWSFASLQAELLSRYADALAGRAAPPLEPPRASYRDFVLLERTALASHDSRAFWRERLAGAQAGGLLLSSREAGAAPGTREVEVLEEPVARRLRQLAATLRVPLKSVYLAAHLCVLRRLTGQDAVLTGLVGHGRPEGTDGERVLGLFLNTVPFPHAVGHGAFSDLVRDVARRETELVPHRRFPLAECLRVSGCPAPESAFNFVHFHVHGREHGVPVEQTRIFEQTNFALLANVVVEPGTERTRVELTLDGGRLAPEVARQAMGCYLRALAEVARHPDVAVESLDLLGPAERERLLVSLNAHPDARRGTARTLVEVFERQVERTPDAVALIAGHASLTYAALDARANHLARLLRARGTGPEAVVALCASRSEALLVAVLGVLKAGAAYVPLDPRYPPERLALMLEDSGAGLVLASEEGRAALPPTSAQVLSLEAALAEPGASEARAPGVPLSGENLAYLIYTSGSTGRPKGTAIEHRSAVRFLEWATAAFTVEELRGVLFSTSLSFDLSIFEMFAPWAAGGTVILAQDALELPALPARERVTLVNTVPSALAALLRMDGLPSGVRCVNLAGEALPRTLADEVLARPGVRRLANLYGPSEDTTYSTWADIVRGDGRAPPIGRPIWYTRAYLLDAHQRPVPEGVPGELYLAGEGLARGYLGRPELTATRFLPDPFAGQPGERMYRTGDLARWREDGLLEFLGRADHQVKVRGHRVEPGEVEEALRALGDVADCVVVAREVAPHDLRLAAYFVRREGTAPSAESLRQALLHRLPEYMVPAAFVPLEALPRTPNGKVDRARLPVPESWGTAEARTARATRTPTEESLAEIWKEVLGRAEVGPGDDFFALGGHSLLATRVITRVRAVFDVELPVRALFEHRTMEALAGRVEAARGQGVATLPPIQHVPPAGPLRASFAQERLYFLSRLDEDSAAYHMANAVRLKGALDVAALARAVEALALRHESLRTTFSEDDSGVLQHVQPPGSVTLDVVDLTGDAEPEAAMRALGARESTRAFDLARGPLFRATLARLAREDHALLVAMHHIISDGWSLGVLTRELSALYNAFRDGQPSPLPELPVQYTDYSRWQRQWLTGDVLEAQLSYWKEKLGDNREVLELPTDRPRPPRQTFRGAMETVVLEEELSSRLLAFGRREGGTLFMTLLTGFLALLARYTGHEAVSVGVPIANRRRTEVEGLIGFFVNTLVLRTDVTGGTFRELFERVKREALEAYSYQDLPFEQLVGELAPERDLSHSPLFQVMFVLQNAATWTARHTPLAHLELKGVEVLAEDVVGVTSKFDLTLGAAETPSGIALSFEYNTDLFERDTVLRLAAHLRLLLRAMAESPDQPWRRVPLLLPDERRRLFSEWNPPAPEEAVAASSVAARVAAQVARSPTALALTDGRVRLSYAELLSRADALADALCWHGVGPDTVVGVCLERSWLVVMAVLGVLRAGGAYLALDPRYPRERLLSMLEEARAPLVITEDLLRERLSGTAATLLPLDAEGHLDRVYAPLRPLLPAEPGNLAYVLCTSGSTGRSKPIGVEHRSVLEFLRWSEQAFSAEEVSGMLFSTSLCFDLSVFEMFAPLTRGGTVILAENILHLAEHPDAERVTLVNTVPSAMTEILRAGRLPGGVLCVNLAGEALPGPLVKRVYEEPGVQRVLNLYGPTEDTIYSTVEVVPRDEAVTPAIGRPVTGSLAWVLDEEGQPVPPGVSGELYLGGRGLARGYLHQPGLTAERFVPDPFSGEPGARMYRTGDRVRYRRDGRLEYLGRIDAQVKLRGFRIELGEVEAALRAHPEVKEAAVVMRGTSADDGRLVAYVVPEAVPRGGAEARSESAAREQLSEWEAAWNDIYSRPGGMEEPGFDITGWNSTFTGEPLPAEVMREWRDGTVARLREVEPRHVLEIGCGTGLLLFPMLPHVEHYHGRDLSERVVERLRRQTAGDPRVSLAVAEAVDLSDVPPGSQDLVVLNSVVQYFPGAAYLLRVLEEAVARTRPGGAVFLGDVRNRQLHRAFRAAVELHRAPPTVPAAQVEEQVEHGLRDEELLVDPAFFRALPRHLPRVAGVRILLKDAKHDSELGRYRYDVVLRLEGGPDARPRQAAAPRVLDWGRAGVSLAEVRRLLEREQPELLVVSGIPNARVLRDLEAADLLAHGNRAMLAGEVTAAAERAAVGGLDPSEVSALGAGLPYVVDVTWSSRGPRLFDVAFLRASEGPRAWRPWMPAAPAIGRAELLRLASDPLGQKRWEALLPRLRDALSERLPAFMVPSELGCLEELPRNVNGKVDRKRLPDLSSRGRDARQPGREPRTPVEDTLQAIFSNVLGLGRVSIDDNFFILGGHSLRAVQVLSRVRSRLGVTLPLHTLFDRPTVALLAEQVESALASFETFEF